MPYIDLDLHAERMDQVALDLQATEPQVRKALNSTLSKMARWLRTRSARGLSKELQVTQKIIRKRLRSFGLRRGRGGAEIRVWYGLDPISLKDLGAKQSRRGVRAGRHQVQGAFLGARPGSTSLRLNGHVFKRKGRARLPIDKQTLEIKDAADVFIEDEMLGTEDFDRQFIKTYEHELAWRTRKQR